MTLNVEVISEETIKPSSPTPNHLKTFQLSLMDQYAPPVHVPLLLFYSANNDHDKVENVAQTNRLKKSLSEVLTQFYPLAGRITSQKTIYCSDEGVSFSEARVSGELKQVLNNPIPEELDQLLPRTDEFYGLGPKVLLSIQVNIFSCGGMTVGVCISHKLLDGSSISVFLNNWASLSRGDSKISLPKFNMTSLFPPKDIPSPMPPMGSSHKVVSKRFIFDAANIAALRAMILNAVENPTRVEVVSALIWKCAMNAVRMRKKSVRSSASVVNFAVNLRGRMDPPLSNDCVGNLMIGLPVESSTDILQQEFHSLVSHLRKEIRSIDSGYVRKFQSNNGLSELYDSTGRFFEMDAKGELESYVISSWCRFPYYEADFGWGKPSSITSVNLVAKNIILLMDTNCGNGIEAWVSLIEEDMASFEREPDIITFTSANTL